MMKSGSLNTSMTFIYHLFI